MISYCDRCVITLLSDSSVRDRMINHCDRCMITLLSDSSVRDRMINHCDKCMITHLCDNFFCCHQSMYLLSNAFWVTASNTTDCFKTEEKM